MAPIAKVTKEIEDTAIPRRLLSCVEGKEAAILCSVTNRVRKEADCYPLKRDALRTRGSPMFGSDNSLHMIAFLI